MGWWAITAHQCSTRWVTGRVAQNDSAPNDGPALGDENLDVRSAISDEGSRVIWTDKIESSQHLYMYSAAVKKTLQLDVVQGPAESIEPGEAVFQTASSDGSKVFFTDGQRLTVDSTAGGNADPDLYECDIIEEAGLLRCSLTDLTVDKNANESADVQGVVLGTDEDGSDVYFVAQGVLTSAESSEHEKALPGRIISIYRAVVARKIL